MKKINYVNSDRKNITVYNYISKKGTLRLKITASDISQLHWHQRGVRGGTLEVNRPPSQEKAKGVPYRSTNIYKSLNFSLLLNTLLKVMMLFHMDLLNFSGRSIFRRRVSGV